MKKLFLLIIFILFFSCKSSVPDYKMLCKNQFYFVFNPKVDINFIQIFYTTCNINIKVFLKYFFNLNEYSKTVILIDKNLNYISNFFQEEKYHKNKIINLDLCKKTSLYYNFDNSIEGLNVISTNFIYIKILKIIIR